MEKCWGRGEPRWSSADRDEWGLVTEEKVTDRSGAKILEGVGDNGRSDDTGDTDDAALACE